MDDLSILATQRLEEAQRAGDKLIVEDAAAFEREMERARGAAIEQPQSITRGPMYDFKQLRTFVGCAVV
jgi:hypothetical protein